jgi:hypothetical protein
MDTIWTTETALSGLEERIARRCGKRRVFVFLRELRHRIFDQAMQARLAEAYKEAVRGKERISPAMLAMALLLQAALDVPDHEVVELTVMDRRWQMVLGCLGIEEPLFAQGTLYNFRQRMIAHGLDRDLFDKTVALARETGGFSATHLRAAFDASPLWGAGRVEDTFNLIGRAAMHVVRSAAERTGRPFLEVATEAGIPVVTATSIKMGLDIDWDDPNARKEGLTKLLSQVQSLGQWLEREIKDQLEKPPLKEQWELVQKLIAQDTEPDPEGGGGRRITDGVAKDRRISISDADMRHGRKSKRKRIDGFKRHIAVDVDTPGVICAVALTAANQPERVAAKDLLADFDRQGLEIQQLFIDRGYLGDEAIEARRQLGGLQVHCKPFPLRNRGLFDKRHFAIDIERQSVGCPNGVVVPIKLGASSRFPANQCDPCPKRNACTAAKPGRGRSLSIHENEPFMIELRYIAKSPEGRANLRTRVKVEHGLATLRLRQGDRARYKGLRKNLFDVRRHATVENLFVIDRLQQAA